MKKKLLAALLAASMAFSLCACGNQGASGTSQPSVTPAIDESTTNDVPESPTIDNQQTEGSPTTDEENTPDVTQGASGETTGTPAPEDSETGKPEGLIVWEQTNPGVVGSSVGNTVYCLNPETGETTTISNLTYQNGVDLGGYYLTAARYGFLGGYCFSDDYSKLMLDKVFSSNSEVHAGWVDADGNFFDVIEALGLQSKSDFDEPVKYYAAGFADGHFCYYDKTTETYYYVPVDNISSSTVQVGKFSNLDKIPESRQFSARNVTSWIDDTHCIVNNSYKRQGVGDWVDSVIFDTDTQTTTEYVPGDSRMSWNGVISPDETQIAFMSAPFSYGVNDSIDIYIIPTNGGDPVKVGGHSLQLGYYQNGPCQLIGWR